MYHQVFSYVFCAVGCSILVHSNATQLGQAAFTAGWCFMRYNVACTAGTLGCSSLTDAMLCRVAQQCQRRIMLTGTPLQNDLGELQNLLQFILPDVFNKEELDCSSHMQVCQRLICSFCNYAYVAAVRKACLLSCSSAESMTQLLVCACRIRISVQDDGTSSATSQSWSEAT